MKKTIKISIIILCIIFLSQLVLGLKWNAVDKTIAHDLNGTLHDDNLSANRVVKDSGTNFLSELLDSILDQLFNRDAAINTTANIENLVNDSYVNVAGDTMTGNLSMSSNSILTVGSIDFNTTANVTHLEGRIHWNDDDKSLDSDTHIDGVSIQIGQEMYIFATNKLGYQINNGQLIYVNGAIGNRPTIALAKGDQENTSQGTMAMATHNCSNNANCFFTTSGLVRDVDTSSFSAGDNLFLSTSIAGGITNVEPSAPNHTVRIGTSLNSNANEGIILLRIINGYELNELHDVNYANTLANNQVIRYNSTNSRWENMNLTITESQILDLTHTNLSGSDVVTMVGNFSGARSNITFTNETNNFTKHNNLQTITVNNSINFTDDDGNTHSFGFNVFSNLGINFGNADETNETFYLKHPEIHMSSITFLIATLNKVVFALQSGKNNSANFIDRSLYVGNANDNLNASFLTNCPDMASRDLNKNWTMRDNCDTTGLGASIIAEGRIVTRMGAFFGGSDDDSELRNDGDANFFMLENDFDISGGPLHITTSNTETVGLAIGEKTLLINENFIDGTLAPFVLITNTADPDEWDVEADATCPDDICAHAGRISTGSTSTIMEANFSTIGFNLTEISFALTTIMNSDLFNISLNNNSGANIELYSTTTSQTYLNITNTSAQFGTSFNNVSVVTLRATCLVSANSEHCSLDDVLVNATAITNTQANVSIQDALIEFGDETCFIKLNGSSLGKILEINCPNVNIVGNTTQTIVASQNVTGDTEAGSFTLNSTTIYDWIEIANTDKFKINESQITDLTHTNRSDEDIQDIAGGMATGNTETLIAVTYQDGDGTMDYVVTGTLSSYTDDLGHFEDNTSWNQNLASTLYADISVVDTNTNCSVSGICTNIMYNLVEDTTPQLGGDLDGNGFNISVDTDDRYCYDASCTVWTSWNGSCLISHTPTTEIKQGSAC